MASFEENMESLEAVVERLERGELGLDESVRLYEQGMALSKACKAELASAEGRVQVLVESPGRGEMKTAALDVPESEGDEGEYEGEEED